MSETDWSTYGEYGPAVGLALVPAVAALQNWLEDRGIISDRRID
ncbi:MAG: hypothetical protein AAGA99_00720 [Actinomycetota bacterium]